MGGQARLTFEKGETARFAISSDVADEIHVHGYDVYKDVPAGGTARFAFAGGRAAGGQAPRTPRTASGL
ncbi:MAG: hypothetical protein H0V26_15390 [Solirubrobacterales bacterium]|nr:hypothetical protein [Solirubrobacterales bacterium]